MDALWTDAEAVLLFGWGDSGGWTAYDVSGALAMQGLFENALPAPAPVEIPTPPPVPPPEPIPVSEYETAIRRAAIIRRQIADLNAELDALLAPFAPAAQNAANANLV
jgi:hypothetical protein